MWTTQTDRGMQCSRSHERSSVATSQCWWKFCKSRRDLPEQEEQLQRQIEGDAAQGLVVKAKNAPSTPERGRMGRAFGSRTCRVSRMVSILRCWQGKSEAHRRMDASRDHGHPETPTWEEKPILVGRFSKDCWLITHRTEQRNSASMDRWKACERRDHERRANPGGEIRSGGVDC